MHRPATGRRQLPALLTCLGWLALCAAPVAAQAPTEGLTVSPPRVSAVADPGVTYGPFGLTNNAATVFEVEVFPVLIEQDRSGGFLVRDDPSSVREARRYLRVRRSGFELSPGASENAGGLLTRRTRRHNFYGGVLFSATPRTELGPSQIQAILQLNGALLLRPPPSLQRIRVEDEGLRAEPAEGERLRVLLALRNTGNTDVTPRGTVRVRDSAGKVVAARRLEAVQIIPGFVVDVPALLTETLEEGDYTLEAAYRVGGEARRARGEMELVGRNEVSSVSARIAEFPAPTFIEGDPVRIEASFETEGNVPFEPTAELTATPTSRDGTPGDPGEPERLESEEAEPGERGEIEGEVELPGDTQYELVLTIGDEERELDSAAVAVNPQSSPGLLTRAGNFLTDNAVALVSLLLVALAGLAVAFALYVRRTRRG